MTQGSTSMWSLTFQGFLTRFFKELTIFPRRKWMRKFAEQHNVVVDQTVRLLRILRDSSLNINAHDKETIDNLSSAFSDVLSVLHQCLARAAVSSTTLAKKTVFDLNFSGLFTQLLKSTTARIVRFT